MSWKLHRQWNWLNRPQPRTSNHQYGLHLYLSIKHHLITVSALGGYKVCRSVEVLFLFSAWVELHQTLNIEHWTTKINRQTQTLLHSYILPEINHPASIQAWGDRDINSVVWWGEVWSSVVRSGVSFTQPFQWKIWCFLNKRNKLTDCITFHCRAVQYQYVEEEVAVLWLIFDK